MGPVAAATVAGVAVVGYYSGHVNMEVARRSHRQLFKYLEGDNGVDEDCEAIERLTDTDVDRDLARDEVRIPGVDDYRPGGRCHLRRRKIKRFVNAAKAKYPNLVEHNNEATRASVHRYLNRKMQDKGMRPSQIQASLPIALELCFVPTPVEIHASRIRKSNYAKARVSDHRCPPGPVRQWVRNYAASLNPGMLRWLLRWAAGNGPRGYSLPRDF